MRLFNKTNKIQEVRISDRYGKGYSVFIEARRYADFEGYQITRDVVNKINSGILVDLTKTTTAPAVSPLVIEPVKVQEVVVDRPTTDAKDGEDVSPAPKSKSSEGTYICEVCGSEYASERGLSMHMSRSHQ